jgi:uncharacterized protein (TIGR03437 family)
MRGILLFVFPAFLAGTLVEAQAPAISAGGVVNNASNQAGIASGSWVTIYGTNLSATTRLWAATDFRDGRLPLSLDGVSVKINNRDAAVYYISPTQINALALSDPATGTVSVTVTNARGTSAPATAAYQTYAPALFTFSPRNGIYPAAVHPDGTLAGRTDLFSGAVATRPPAPGDRILLYGTGFGPVTPAADPAVLFSGAAPLAEGHGLSILVGGQRATIEWAGLVSNGLYQFNIVVPNVSDGDQTLVAQIGGRSSQSTLRLTVQSRPKPQIRYPGLTRANAEGCPGAGCIGSVTASPGEQIEYWIGGSNLANANGVKFVPPEGIATTVLETSASAIRVLSVISPGAAHGERKFIVTSPEGDSNESAGRLNISTFRIKNLRLSDVTNVNNTLQFRMTVDYSDPTGAVSSGALYTVSVLVYSGGITAGFGNSEPEGRVPGATAGTMTLMRSFQNIRGTTGGMFLIDFTKDERRSDTLRVAF